MRLSKNSWHYKLNKILFAWEIEFKQQDFCSYFWLTILSIFAVPLLYPYIFVSNMLETKIDPFFKKVELNIATNEDIYASYVALTTYSDKILTGVSGMISAYWISENKLPLYSSSRECVAKRLGIDDYKNFKKLYTKCYLFSVLRSLTANVLLFLPVMYSLIITFSIFYIFIKDMSYMQVIKFSAIGACIIIAALTFMTLSYVFHSLYTYKNIYKPDTENEYHWHYGFFKAAVKNFKSESCSRIEWVD